MMERRDFCVYTHWHHDTGHPVCFYVGKGLPVRPLLKTGRTNFWHRVAKKHGYTVVITKAGLSEQEAHALEVSLIRSIGRRNTGTGTLVNMTDGGEGATGYSHDDATKEKIGASKRGRPSKLKGRPRPDAVKLKMSVGRRGKNCKPRTEEEKLNISTKLIGITRSPETRAKMSMGRKGQASKLRGRKRSPEAIAAVVEGRRRAALARAQVAE